MNGDSLFFQIFDEFLFIPNMEQIFFRQKEARRKLETTLFRAGSSVVVTLASHARGQGFKSPPVHLKSEELTF